MLEKANAKIKSEMDANKNNAYIQVVGSFLLQHLETKPADAGKIAVDGKTIAKSLGEMRKAAEKKKVGSCAVLTDKEGFAVVLEYFGINGGAVQVKTVSGASAPAAPAGDDFDVKLDDLLK